MPNLFTSEAAESACTLQELLNRVRGVLTAGQFNNVWVTAETLDVRGGTHYYMELLQKDDQGRVIARVRGIIWHGKAISILPKFSQATGLQFKSDMKVLLNVSLNFTPEYGMSLIINDIDPTYTLGDLMRRRMEAIKRLTDAGIINNNRNLPWPEMPWRIAVISAKGAAGYGDFINQLFNNDLHLRFHVKLFESLMQGDQAAGSVVNALHDIYNDDIDNWDCVVIIRGGGATADLAAFEDYNLAETIAQFPIPVIIGIGHERDSTLLDYVANMRVKTPTAAAAWLIDRGAAILGRLSTKAVEIARLATERTANSRTMLERFAAALPILPQQALTKAEARINNARTALASIPPRLSAERTSLEARVNALQVAIDNTLSRQKQRLNNAADLLSALSPMQTLQRGYSITRINGHAVRNVAELNPGDVITTILADGKVQSQVVNS